MYEPSSRVAHGSPLAAMRACIAASAASASSGSSPSVATRKSTSLLPGSKSPDESEP